LDEKQYRLTLVDESYGITRVIVQATSEQEARDKFTRDNPHYAAHVVTVDTHPLDSPAGLVRPHWPAPTSPAEERVDAEIERFIHDLSELDHRAGELLEAIAELPEGLDLVYANLRSGTLGTVERSMLNVLTLLVQATIRLEDKRNPRPG
jgi:hypothetical protein